MNDLPPPSPRAVRRARIAIDVAIIVAGVAVAFALTRHPAPALVTLAVALLVAVTAFVVIMREFSR
ncbi:hypothetical protein AWL63_19185 [Sphingomonas panacis]|uniref:Uncharacterized protein n=1 Tax=Sphingomonas panacis TaxID=1560345 RepID=A0A1B3ZEA8_9SPHN|nr:hypothetical protein [Sphingomonas panacis]AOH85754.1 hypothetical protein AWL63_19185 [Sphingomonas panacis]